MAAPLARALPAQARSACRAKRRAAVRSVPVAAASDVHDALHDTPRASWLADLHTSPPADRDATLHAYYIVIIIRRAVV